MLTVSVAARAQLQLHIRLFQPDITPTLVREEILSDFCWVGGVGVVSSCTITLRSERALTMSYPQIALVKDQNMLRIHIRWIHIHNIYQCYVCSLHTQRCIKFWVLPLWVSESALNSDLGKPYSSVKLIEFRLFIPNMYHIQGSIKCGIIPAYCCIGISELMSDKLFSVSCQWIQGTLYTKLTTKARGTRLCYQFILQINPWPTRTMYITHIWHFHIYCQYP